MADATTQSGTYGEPGLSLVAPDSTISVAPNAPSTSRDALSSLGTRLTLLPLAAVFLCYAAAALFVPTFAPVSISDDWTYTRSVEYLINDHRIHILSVAAATQIFQLFWGALFAEVFGMTFGALRLSTVVIVGLGGLALFGLCRELGVNRSRSALGTAVFLFNPVLFPIAYSFMSDPHFIGLLVIATYLYVRGFRDTSHRHAATWCGAIAASLGCLQRPHGALIPLGVVTYLVLSRRIGFNRQSIAPFLRVVAVPALTFLAYYFVISRGLPNQQGLFFSEMKNSTPSETWLLVRRLTVMEMGYIGLFIVPIAVASLVGWRALFTFGRMRGTVVFILWQTILVAGFVWFWLEDRRMPFIPHFLGRGGPGSADLRNARPALAPNYVFDWVTIACGACALLFGFMVIRGFDLNVMEKRPAAGMTLAIGAWQVVGVVPPSFLFRNWIVSLDRYLLPLLPFAVALSLWSLSQVKVSQLAGWMAIAAIALFSVAGTRDVLVFQTDVWNLAERLNQAGVPDTRLDAGYAWDAYHLWEYGEANHVMAKQFTGSWWTDVYAPATDSTYLISGGPIDGYTVLSKETYSAWLQRKPVALYVLRRADAPEDDVQWPVVSR